MKQGKEGREGGRCRESLAFGSVAVRDGSACFDTMRPMIQTKAKRRVPAARPVTPVGRGGTGTERGMRYFWQGEEEEVERRRTLVSIRGRQVENRRASQLS